MGCKYDEGNGVLHLILLFMVTARQVYCFHIFGRSLYCARTQRGGYSEALPLGLCLSAALATLKKGVKKMDFLLRASNFLLHSSCERGLYVGKTTTQGAALKAYIAASYLFQPS